MKQEFVTLPREVVKRVMDALYYTATTKSKHPNQWKEEDAAMKELRAALEQPQGEQETVAWLHPDWPAKKYKGAQSPVTTYMVNDWIPLYTHQQPKREPLTDAEIGQAVRWLYQDHRAAEMGLEDDIAVARAIEAAHNIK